MNMWLANPEIEWEDGTIWTLSWCRDAGCFFADRWIPEEDDFPYDELIAAPAGEEFMVESLDVLEEAMGRPLPADIRDYLRAWSEAYPIRPEVLESWDEWSAFAVMRRTPDGEWLETFAPPGCPNPLAYEWIPEATLWAWAREDVDG